MENAAGAINPALIDPIWRMGLHLEQLRGFNFSPIEAEAKLVFKNTKLHFRHVSVASRVSLDGTGQYNRPVVRLFGGVSEQQQQVLVRLHKELRANVKALQAEQAGVLQQGYVQTILPNAAGELRLKTWLPYQIASVEFDDPFEDDLSKARRVVLLLPVSRGVIDAATTALLGASPWCARVVLERERAFIEYPDQTRRGIWADSLENPTGRVPAFGTRRVVPIDGTGWSPRPAEDVWSQNVGLILALSDAEAIIRDQAPSKPTLEGLAAAEAAKESEGAPNRWMVLPPETKAAAVSFDPQIEKYLRVPETGIYLMSQYRYLRPEAYAASIVTGSARRADAEGYTENIAREEQRVDQLEQDRVDLLCDVYNASRAGALKLSKPEVKVVYRYPQSGENALQIAQAKAIAYQHGAEDVLRDVMVTEGLTELEAERLIIRRLETWDRLIRDRIKGAGLDKIARDGVTNDLPRASRP